MNFISDLISESRCFKSINQICIVNFVTSKKIHFMNTLIFETGVSDQHKLIETMLRFIFAKGKPKKHFTAVTKTLAMKGLKKK